MSDTTITSTLSGAQSIDPEGDTFNVSGSWTSDYDPSGTLLSVSDVNITITGTFADSSTDKEVFTGASVVSDNGTYEIEPIVSSSDPGQYDYGSIVENQYGSTYDTGPTLTKLSWTSETPTSLGISSEIAIGPAPNEVPSPFSSAGVITNTISVTSLGQSVDAGGNFANTSVVYDGPVPAHYAAGTVTGNSPIVSTVTNLGIGDSVTISASDFPPGVAFFYGSTGSDLEMNEIAFVNGDLQSYFAQVDISGPNGQPLDPNDLVFTTLGDGSAVFTVICFYPGTNVRTQTGDVAVESLKAGDLVTLSDGRMAPISWLGRQTVSTKFADPLRVLPIRIKAHALGESMPARDLLISPDHAILVNDILIQAGALVNGVSIIRETDVPETFTYYHVEVADHSLVLAENLAAETFIDNVGRMAFDNWEEHEALETAAITEMAYPRAKSARQVPQSIRARLLARAQALYGAELASAA